MASDAYSNYVCIGTTSVEVIPRITRFFFGWWARELHALEMGLQDDGEGKPVACAPVFIFLLP